MQHLEFDPPELLKDAIKCIWHDQKEYPPHLSPFEVLPDGYAEIIFYFGSLFSQTASGNFKELPSPFIMGLLNKPAVFYSKNRFEILAIRCYPWTVFDLLGLPSIKKEIHFPAHPITSLQPILQDFIRQQNIAGAVEAIKQFLLQVHAGISTKSMLFKAGVAMNKAKGTMPVKHVAKAAHVTIRTLERNFKQSSGHTIKDVSGVMRFEQVRNRLWTEPQSNIAGLAQEFGYTDQAHLTKEFKKYTGTTPSAFAKKAGKSKNIVPNDFVAFLQD